MSLVSPTSASRPVAAPPQIVPALAPLSAPEQRVHICAEVQLAIAKNVLITQWPEHNSGIDSVTAASRERGAWQGPKI